jgi:membrane-associated protein
MEILTAWITQHIHIAPWLIALLIILASVNLPISIDILLAFTAFLASNALKEKAILLYGIFILACIIAASTTYWLSRCFGRKLLKIKLFSKVLSKSRLQKIENIYKKYGCFVFIAARFIPFGVRNCVFFFSGISKTNYAKFLFFDTLGCVIWCASFAFLFTAVGQNYQLLISTIKTVNICILVALVTFLTTFLLYKWRKKRKGRAE